jgi:hypothetical protein
MRVNERGPERVSQSYLRSVDSERFGKRFRRGRDGVLIHANLCRVSTEYNWTPISLFDLT